MKRGGVVRVFIVMAVLCIASVSSGAEISGRISGLVSGENACVDVYEVVDSNTCDYSRNAGGTGVDSNGDYSLAVSAGTYFLQAEPGFGCGDNTNNLVREFWTSESSNAVLCSQAETFTVEEADQTVKNITLDVVGGAISGTVYDDEEQPLVDVPIHINVHSAAEPCGELIHVRGEGDLNSPDGTYIIEGIPPGDYYLNTYHNGTAYLDEYWDGTDSDRDCNNAQLITVESGQTESNKDFYLQEGAIISGNVAGLASGESACITAYELIDGNTCDSSSWAGGSGPDSNGDYSFVVPPGTYFMHINPSCGDNSNNLVAEYWTSDEAGNFDCNQADTFTVAASELSTKNITLDVVGGAISGTVYDDEEQPLVDVPIHINVHSAAEPCGELIHVRGEGDLNSPDGTYIIEGIPPGDYYLNTYHNGTAYLDEYWDGTNSDRDCANAQLITVTSGQTESNKDFYLQQGALISGNVAGLASGENACITAYELIDGNSCDNSSWAGGAGPDSNGDYSFVVPPGTFFMHVDPNCGANSNNLLDEYWTADHAGTTDCSQAAQFTLEKSDQTTKNITLDNQGAVISGTISGNNGQNVCVNLQKKWDGGENGCDTDWAGGGVTDSSGAFSFVAPAGTYYLNTDVTCGNSESNDGNLYDKYWTADNQGTTDCFSAEEFTVSVGTNDAKDIVLEEGAVISGTISGNNGQNVCVNLQKKWDGGENGCETDWAGGGVTDSSGAFSFVAPAGTYYLNTDATCGNSESNDGNLVDKFWTTDNQGTTECFSADEFTVSVGANDAKDIVLEEGARISGNVAGLVSGENACITAYELIDGNSCDSSSWGGGSGPDSNGDYSFVVSPGTYFIHVDPGCGDNSNNLVAEYWTSDEAGNFDCNQADTFTVTAGEQSTKNITLDVVGGAISGTVYDDEEQPLIDVPIHINVHSGAEPCGELIHVRGDGDLNSPDGTYIIKGIPPGDYYLNTWHNGTGYIDEYWDGTNSDPDCANAQLITVTSGQTESNKDFYLTKDSDGDNLSDTDEAAYGLDPAKKDSDGDGLEDAVEVALFTQYYSIPFDGDLDSDGTRNIDDDDIDGDNESDIQELARGSNPANADSVPPALVLYEDFSSSTLDPEKWHPEQYAMEVVDGNLRLFADSSSDYSLSNYLQSFTDSKLKVTLSINDLDNNLVDDEAIGFNLLTNPYTTNDDPNLSAGRVYGYINIGNRGNGLEVWHGILVNTDGSPGYEIVDEGLLADSDDGLALNTVYSLEIVYDGNNNFTFAIYDNNGLQVGQLGSGTGPAFGTLLDKNPRLRVKTPVTGGRIDVNVIQVETGNDSYTIYDDFSRSSLDPAKWRNPEIVKEIDGGEIKLLAHTFGDAQIRTPLEFAKYYPYVEAEVVIDPVSWQTPARGRSQLLFASMYNASRGPGSGQSYNGIEGDWEGSVNAQKRRGSDSAYAYMWIGNYTGPTWDDAETAGYGEFDLPITTNVRYKLFFGFAGDFIVTGIENMASGEIDAHIERITTAKYLPAHLLAALRSRVYGGDGEAKHLSYFENVYVGGDVLFDKGDINLDGAVNLGDIIQSLQTVTGTSNGSVWFHGDMNDDGAIGLPDAIGILNQLSQQ